MSKSYQPKSPAWSSGAHRAQYVIPYGIGGNPFGVDVFGSAMQLFDKIAARVFGPWRLPVLQPPTTARCLWTYVRDRVPLRRRAILQESGSEHPTTARIHLNGAATHPLTETQVRSISSSWTIVPGERSGAARVKKCRFTPHGQCRAPVAGDRETPQPTDHSSKCNGWRKTSGSHSTPFPGSVCPLLILWTAPPPARGWMRGADNTVSSPRIFRGTGLIAEVAGACLKRCESRRRLGSHPNKCLLIRAKLTSSYRRATMEAFLHRAVQCGCSVARSRGTTSIGWSWSSRC